MVDDIYQWVRRNFFTKIELYKGVLNDLYASLTHSHQSAGTGGQLDHGAALTGIADDDHTQYTLLAGRSGGQTIKGGTGSGDDLTLESTSHATKGDVVLNPSGGKVGVKTSSPGRSLHIAGTLKVSTNDALFTTDSWGKGIEIATSHVIQWLTGGGSISRGMGLTSDNVFYVMRSTADDNSSAAIYDLVIDSNGDIGIGTTAPNFRLHVKGDNNASFALIKLENSQASGHSWWLYAGASGVAGNFGIYDETAGAYRLMIDSSGRVGVGVDSSSAKLQINGGVAIVDGMSAPSTISGYAQIYVDSADGDLKVKFGDGTVKTIVVDT